MDKQRGFTLIELMVVSRTKPDANPSACRTHLSGRVACVIAPGS
ncbi:prepilin-type N-terminal cleavage/methylation domain-containing protein [Escherichia coli]|nr:prepilin-type N-terminal cleavage/methylation domain-containing protein [Escherichia coli]EHI0062614.1 prepilin-type N-terminal cleavage/methylation domain-containing protein [Escherichia coli]